MILPSATLPIKYRQSGPEKIAQSLMHSHFATVCSRITGLKPKCSEKITVQQPMQNVISLLHIL